MPDKMKAVVAGHICLDITPLFPNRPAELIPGKLLHMDGVDVHTGGAVANTGLAMKFLGADVQLMGKIGNDEFGKLVMQILRQHGYEGDMILSPDSGTSYSVVIAMPGIDRIFLHAPGANDTLCCADLDFEAIGKARLFHFGYPPIMKRMYGDNGRELVEIFRKVKSLGVTTSLDMAAVDPSSDAGKADWKEILSSVMPCVDFFVPSVEELCFMLDRERYADWLRRADGGDVTRILDIEKDVKPLADRLLEMGAKVLLIKCGAPGLYFRTADADQLTTIPLIDADRWANLEHFEKSYVPAQVLSGTGAGDTSIAAFLTAILEGRDPMDCLRLAAATGASCVEGYDALSGLKPFPALEAKIAAGWEKQHF